MENKGYRFSKTNCKCKYRALRNRLDNNLEPFTEWVCTKCGGQGVVDFVWVGNSYDNTKERFKK